MTLFEKYESQVLKKGPDECWGWAGTVQQKRGTEYGVIWFEKKMYRAYRVAWVQENGPLLPGEQVYRSVLCESGLCTNPRHLRDKAGRAAEGAAIWSDTRLK